MKTRSGITIGGLFCIVLLLLFMVGRAMEEKQDNLAQQLRDSLDTQANISLLLHHLGYTGFIHNFKNYVLRGDEQYYIAALENLKNIDALLENGRPRYQELKLEQQFEQIARTVKTYEVKLELARRLRNQNLTADEIDAQVVVDDTEASKAVRHLIAQYQIQSANLSRAQFNQAQQQDNLFYLVEAFSLLLAIATTVISWLVISNVRQQLRQQTQMSSRQKLLDASPNPTLVVAESGDIIVANQGAGYLFECHSDELIGRTVEDFIPESMRSQHINFRTLFFSSGGERTMRNPVALTTLTGKQKRVEVMIGLYRLEQELFAVVNLLDVSNVEDIQRHAAEVEQTFRMTFELAPIGIAQVSLEGRFIKVNQQFANILGYQGAELEYLSIDDICHPAEREFNHMAVNRLINRDVDHVRFEKPYITSSGADVWVIHTLSLYRDETGRPEYLISIFEDISYRKQYEQELMASEAKFKSIANHVQGVVWMATPGIDQVLFVSNRYEEIWGRSIASLMQDARSFINAILPEDQPKVLAEIENHRKGHWNVDYRILGRDGNVRFIHDEGAPVRSENGDLLYLVGLARDVTDEQVAKERLKQTNKQLEQLAKFDPLTMAVRRPYAITDLDDCLALYKRYATGATLIFIDLNDFKSVNDRYGHEAGDQVLAKFAGCVRENIRETDAFYRYAGDEFLLLLRETGANEAASFLRKLEAALDKIQLPEYDDVSVSISCGAVTLAGDVSMNAQAWINHADERMYQHKKLSKRKG